MEDLSRDEINGLISECTHYQTQTRTYVRLLGIHQLSNSSRGDTGKQTYSTPIVQDFAEATGKEVTRFIKRYESRQEVQQAVSYSRSELQRYTDKCLEPYGPKIWGNGSTEPQITRTDEFYPKCLIWDDQGDRKRIQLYTFCWVIQRACRRVQMKKRECGGNLYDADGDAPNHAENDGERLPHRSFRDVIEGIGTISTRPSTLPTKAVSSSSSSKVRSVILEDTGIANASASVQDFRAPEATMVRNPPGLTSFSVRDATIPRRPPPQSHMQDVSPTVNLQHNDCALRGEGGSGNDAGRRPTSSEAIAMHAHERSLVARKRRRSTIDIHEATSFSSLQNTGKLKPVRQIKRKGSSSGLSRSHPPTGSRTYREQRQSPEDIFSIPDSRDQATMVGCEDGLVEATSREVHDVDSVLGDAAVAGMNGQPAAPMAPEGTHSSLIVRLKLNSVQGYQLRSDRRRLARSLLLCFDTDAQMQSPIRETMDLIQKLWSSDRLRLRESLNHAFDSYDTALSRWRRCIEILTTFQRRTQFCGDRSAWNAHFESLQIDARHEARRYFLDAVVQMGDWLDEQRSLSVQKFSDDVAVALLTMADWMDTMNDKEDRDSFIEVVTRFNKSLLDRFM
ncbi:hypothetical protein FB567DRAFT_599003 [Paraphoma chrysanthemicola]|uniref:Uncharacterized protein n=1 Tax=Paraphoma chrysanthemicola TaxID=798071 RepID=A0A8K0QSA5_9PLEO|nr:hypothetical protein FB567DRAFT_599003 [Paraphoma chrysanthemicola]